MTSVFPIAPARLVALQRHACAPQCLLTSAALAVLAGMPDTVAAQDRAAPLGLPPIVVSATRTPQPLDAVLADVTVIERAEIERSGALGVADLLARLPGMEMASTGGPASTTSVFIRGAENRHTAVYLDGMRLDSQSTGGVSWEAIPLDQIDRVEVVRGPAAAVYGSDAIGGVVQLFTRRGAGTPRVNASLSAGSHRTVQGSAGISGAMEQLDYSLNVSAGRSRGFNAQTNAGANPDDDGWRRHALQARAGLKLDTVHRLDVSMLASHLRAEYDDFFGAPVEDVSRQQLRSGRLGWQGKWNDDATTRASFGASSSTYETQPSYYRTETLLRDTSLQHEQRIASAIGQQVLTGILERREDRLTNPATQFDARLDGKRHQNALGLAWRLDAGAHALQLQARRDDDSEFGGHNTGSVAWGWQFMPAWRVSASAGTSFRAPTLYQRFSPYGNAALQPEEGRNVELGLRWSEGVHEASFTAWRNTVKQLISFGAANAAICSSPFGCYENTGRARLEGFTLAGATELAGLRVRGAFDWHDPRNLDTDTTLARRARRFASFGVDSTLAAWSLGAELKLSGKRWDDAANTVRLGGYGLVNLVASRPLMPGLSFEARLDNVGDKDYALAEGYATAGRTLMASLRWATP